MEQLVFSYTDMGILIGMIIVKNFLAVSQQFHS